MILNSNAKDEYSELLLDKKSAFIKISRDQRWLKFKSKILRLLNKWLSGDVTVPCEVYFNLVFLNA